MELKVIAYARNGHTDKFGIPRQSREESPILTRIVFEPGYNVTEALRGIEGYSHLWLLWGFQLDRCADRVKTANTDRPQEEPAVRAEWSPTVRPPRLGGNKRMGVFATRSPFRPNPIGLSSVKLVQVLSNQVPSTKSGRMELIVSGADVLDGTPIYDIKPYLSFSDCHPEAKNGFAEETKDYELNVDWSLVEVESACKDGEKAFGADEPSTNLRSTLAECPSNHPVITPLSPPYHPLSTVVKREIEYILRQDPRPGYQNDPAREYKMDYGGMTVTFSVDGKTVRVKRIEGRGEW